MKVKIIMSERMVKNYAYNTALSFGILLTRLLIHFGECIIHYLAEAVNMARNF